MAAVSYARHQFPPDIIRHVLWLYLRFFLSYRDVEDLLAERGVDISHETVRRWVLKFGVLFARELRKRRPRPSSQWHLDELVVVISGKRFFLWRAVDCEGEVLDLLVQRRRDKTAAVTSLRKLLKKQGYPPDVIVTDKLRSYGAAKAQTGLSAHHEQACARRTGPKTRTSRYNGVSAKCSRSSHPDRPSASLRPMPPFTIPSTFSVISSPAVIGKPLRLGSPASVEADSSGTAREGEPTER